MELTNHTALITGGTAGIGLESARLMAEEGASVIIAGRNRHRGEEAVALLGANARFVEADMADASPSKRLSGNAETSTSSSTTQPAFPPR